MDSNDRHLLCAADVTILVAARNILDSVAQRLVLATDGDGFYTGRSQARSADAALAIYAALNDLGAARRAPIGWDAKGQPVVARTPASELATTATEREEQS